jgi:hypothetical protein
MTASLREIHGGEIKPAVDPVGLCLPQSARLNDCSINPLIRNEDPVRCISPWAAGYLVTCYIGNMDAFVMDSLAADLAQGLSRSHRLLRHEILCPRRRGEPSRVSLRLQRACDRYFAGRDRNRGSGRREGPGDTRQLQGKQGGDWRRHRRRSRGGSDCQRIHLPHNALVQEICITPTARNIEHNGAPTRQELRQWPTPNCNCETRSSTSAAG